MRFISICARILRCRILVCVFGAAKCRYPIGPNSPRPAMNCVCMRRVYPILPAARTRSMKPAVGLARRAVIWKSFAMVALRTTHTFGMLVLASEDAGRFYQGMGTLYLKRLGELVSVALDRALANEFGRVRPLPPTPTHHCSRVSSPILRTSGDSRRSLASITSVTSPRCSSWLSTTARRFANPPNAPLRGAAAWARFKRQTLARMSLRLAHVLPLPGARPRLHPQSLYGAQSPQTRKEIT